MLGSAICIAPSDLRDGWASLQNACGAARGRLISARSAPAIAEAWTALSAGRLASFATMTLHRAQRLNRLTAAALLTSPDFGLLGDKDIDPYRMWRVVPYTDSAQQVLRAVRADLELLREKSRELRLDLHVKLGGPGRELPRRLCLFFRLEVATNSARTELRRVAFKRAHLQALTEAHFRQPANIGRHYFVSALVAAGTDTWLIAAATGHGHVGAEVFSDSTSVAPLHALKCLKEALESILTPLKLEPVPGAASDTPAASVAGCPAPSLLSDPYLHPRRGSRGRILPPAADPLTLVSSIVVGRVEKLLATKASIPELRDGDIPTCLVTLDGVHPADMLEAQAQMPDALRTTNQTLTLVWTRSGCAGEILQPLCARTTLALSKAKSTESVCSDALMCSAGAWIRPLCPEVSWPEDNREAFLAYCALAQRWHRFVQAPAELAASSRAIYSASANRESVLRLADSHRPKRYEDLPFAPLRTGISKERIRLRSALAELKRQVGVQGNTRARRGEEQRRSRNLLNAIERIDTAGDMPALRAKEVLEQECRCWIDDDLRNSGAGRQYSSLRTYSTHLFASLELISPADDMSMWTGPDFSYWFSRAKTAISKASNVEEPDMVGVRRFLLVGRDRLGWDVPDEVLRGVSAFQTDGQRMAAAATLVYSFDYVNARLVIDRRLAEWPMLLEPSRIDLALRGVVPLRSGERATIGADCLTAASDRLILRNAGFSDKKSPSGVRLCTLPTDLAAAIRQRVAAPAREGYGFLFLDGDGDDWSVFDAIDQVGNEALALVTGDPSYRPHCGRASAGCNIAWPGWEPAAQGIFRGRAVSAASSHPGRLDFTRVVRATLECGQGHASTFLTYYSSVWPYLRAISANARLGTFEPDDAFVAEALGNTDAVRTARSRARRIGERFSAWDVIARIAAQRCALPALVRRQPLPVVAAAVSSGPTQEAIAKFVLARTTGTPRDEAAHRFGIAISLAKTIELKLGRRGK